MTTSTERRHLLHAAPAPAAAGPSGGRLASSLDRDAESSTHENRLVILAVAGAHLLGLWALLQVDEVRAAVREVAPTLIEFIVAREPAKPEPPPPTPPVRVAPKLQPPPVIAAAPSPTAAPVFTVPPAPAEPTPALPVQPVAAAPSPVAPPAPPPAAPRLIPATAVEYLVRPPIEVPLASRRLGESGTVWLRVRVSREGTPQQITLSRSSGHARLDQQAQDAMRQARFRPQTENGQTIEWIVVAPLQYDIE